jgi:hypothetical protein
VGYKKMFGFGKSSAGSSTPQRSTNSNNHNATPPAENSVKQHRVGSSNASGQRGVKRNNELADKNFFNSFETNLDLGLDV